MDEHAYIEFDIPAICQLKEDYEKTIEFIKDELPDINWNSITETSDYFRYEHNINLYSLSIVNLKELLNDIQDNDSETIEYATDTDVCCFVLTGLIELKKLQYTLRNYINNILKHNEGGYYPLRKIDGQWRMMNKQPLSYLQEIQECVISQSI